MKKRNRSKSKKKRNVYKCLKNRLKAVWRRKREIKNLMSEKARLLKELLTNLLLEK
jgi:hypothetical protein